MKEYIKRSANNIIKKTHWYNEVLFKDCRKFWDLKDEQFDVVNLGSGSGTYDFCYDDCGLKGANWAVAPQSTLGDFIILKQYRRYIKDGGIVIYPLCPFTAISGAVPYLPPRCFSFIDYKTFPGGHYITSYNIQSERNNPLVFYPLFELFRDIIWYFRGSKDIVRSEKYLVKDAVNKINGWKDQFNISSLDERFIGRFDDVYQATIKMMSEIIDYCDKEGLKLVFTIPPVYHSLAELLTPAAREQLLDSFMDKANRDRVLYYNLLDDEEFINDKSLFRDSYYLNKKGAKKFTNIILNRIKAGYNYES